MNAGDKQKFFSLIGDVLAFYGKDYSEFAGRVWWEAMRPYDFVAVADALNRHCVNPDSGQYVPKPADVVKMLSGSTQDSALAAWSKVDRAIREVGTYRSVVFDDATIHRVITDMGGWVLIGGKHEDEWPFVRNEFVNRYRGYRGRSETPEYLPVLIGIAEAANTKAGFISLAPTLIGNPQIAHAVMLAGLNRPLMQLTPADFVEAATRAITDDRSAA